MRITCKVCGSYLELNRIYVKVYCKACENAYQREYSKNYVPTVPYQMKKRSRALANKSLKRGKLIRKPCEKCGDSKAEMHHEDYSKPLDVNWLCRKCHLELHEQRKLEENSEELGTRK